MKIETKYNINDTVYFLAESSIWIGAITEIRVSVNKDIQVKYDVKCVLPNVARFTGLKEDKLFKSKEDLIASL